MKLCKDCKYCSDFELDGYLAKCDAPQNIKDIDIVTGNPQARWIYCSSHRQVPFGLDFLFKTCGSRGRWFKRKEKKENYEKTH